MGSVVLLCLCVRSVGAQQIEGFEVEEGQVVLIGLAIDSTTGHPLVGAAIYVMEHEASAVVDSLGRFALGPLDPDFYRVSFYHERLIELDLPAAPVFLVDLGEPGLIRADVYIPRGEELATLRTQEVTGAQPFVLDPILVEVEQAQREDRLREGAAMAVLERSDIIEQVERARHIGDLLTGIPSLRVRQVRGALCVETRRSPGQNYVASRDSPCRNQVAVVMDNVPLAQPEFSLAQIRPEDIQRVEFVNGLVAGARYGRQASNGVLVIETRVPRSH